MYCLVSIKTAQEKKKKKKCEKNLSHFYSDSYLVSPWFYTLVEWMMTFPPVGVLPPRTISTFSLLFIVFVYSKGIKKKKNE